MLSSNARSRPRYFALVPCAGKGERSGSAGPKQYVALAGQAMVAYPLQALSTAQGIDQLLVVLHPDDVLFESHVPDFSGWIGRVGGATRAHSVLNGLGLLIQRGALPEDWVLVHDAARCLLQPSWVDRLIQACQDDPVGGLLALPVTDTLKQAHEGRVFAGLDRANKWQAQTPQMFRLGLLQQALEQALAHDAANITDESSAMERAGYSPLLVPGSPENLKVTYPSDFKLVEKLLQWR
ncbi:MAG: 2-C-methyl-D-erythritol 4-phosphate cytidylyltransferase [Burkholderiales bacterium]